MYKQILLCSALWNRFCENQCTVVTWYIEFRASNMPDQIFLTSFVSGTLSPAEFDHAAHIRAACLLLQSRPFLEACIAMRDGLSQIAAKAGKPQLYHETITVAFMAVIAGRLADGAPDWQNLVATQSDLFDRALLQGYYSAGLLDSDKARKHFLLPDRIPVAAAA